MALMIPSGLHAKQLAEFCMMNGTSAEADMAADHSCCETMNEPADQHDSETSHHDCDWGFICACNIGQSQLGDTEWIISTNDVTVTLTESENLTTFITSADPIHSDQQQRIGQHTPPLWLLYDTFLN